MYKKKRNIGASVYQRVKEDMERDMEYKLEKMLEKALADHGIGQDKTEFIESLQDRTEMRTRKSSQASVPSPPLVERTEVDDISESTVCKLLLRMASDHPVEAATGMAYPRHDGVLHGKPMEVSNTKVQVDSVLEHMKSQPLVYRPNDEIRLLGEAEGTFVQWPKRDVRLASPSVSATEARGAQVEDVVNPAPSEARRDIDASPPTWRHPMMFMMMYCWTRRRSWASRQNSTRIGMRSSIGRESHGSEMLRS